MTSVMVDSESRVNVRVQRTVAFPMEPVGVHVSVNCSVSAVGVAAHVTRVAPAAYRRPMKGFSAKNFDDSATASRSATNG